MLTKCTRLLKIPSDAMTGKQEEGGGSETATFFSFENKTRLRKGWGGGREGGREGKSNRHVKETGEEERKLHFSSR